MHTMHHLNIYICWLTLYNDVQLVNSISNRYHELEMNNHFAFIKSVYVSEN